MNFLLTADLHLTSNPIDEYRWKIFEFLQQEAIKHKVEYIYILGDAIDRKDRHPGRFVNRLVDSLHDLRKQTHTFINILAGNHDKALEGVDFWEFLNKNDGITYITQPEYHLESIWVLPFSSNPIRDWKEIPWYEPRYGCNVILMHQPVEGAFIDEYRKIEKAPILPELPDVPVYSGDIHQPQKLGKITYIGIPHPTKFDEMWRNRVLLIRDSNWEVYEEIWLPTIRRGIVEISTSSELQRLDYKSGDQLRIRVKLDGKNLISWAEEESKIRQWAGERNIYLASVEAKIEGDSVKEDKEVELSLPEPEQVLRDYGKQEKLSDEIIDVGLELLS